MKALLLVFLSESLLMHTYATLCCTNRDVSLLLGIVGQTSSQKMGVTYLGHTPDPWPEK